MYKSKIENFSNEYPNKSFPWFEFLEPCEAEKYRLKILRKMKMNATTSPAEQVEQLFKHQKNLENVNADTAEFKMEDVFHKLNIKPDEYIFINWYRFDHIDKMKFNDFVEYFDYIWYAGPDDIDIFDKSLKWIVTIDHHGYVRWVLFDER